MKSICVFLAALCLLVMAYWPEAMLVEKPVTSAVAFQPDDVPVQSTVKNDGDYNIFLHAWNAQLSAYEADGNPAFTTAGYSNGGDYFCKLYREKISEPRATVMLFPFGMLLLFCVFKHVTKTDERDPLLVQALATPEPSRLTLVSWSIAALACGTCVVYGGWQLLSWLTYFSAALAFLAAIGTGLATVLVAVWAIITVLEIWGIQPPTHNGTESCGNTGLATLAFTMAMMSSHR